MKWDDAYEENNAIAKKKKKLKIELAVNLYT